jgi:hypothetical protein
MGSVLNAVGLGRSNNGIDSMDEIRAKQLAAEAAAASSLKEIQPQQSAFAQQLAQGALGQGPSLADAQMKLAMDRSLQQQMAMAQSQRGTNPALAGRNAAMGAAQASADIGGQAGVARLQEQRQQQGAFQQYLGGQQQYQLGALGQAGQSAADSAKLIEQQRGADMRLIGGLIQGGASAMAAGGGGAKAAQGGIVKAPEVTPGDHESNDIVPAMLSGGEVVVPKTVVEKGGKAAGEFVEALKAHMDSKERLKNATFGDVLLAKQAKKEKKV